MSKECSKELGQLLLKGWGMLAESCPTCSVPLMRNPDDKSQKLCVNCKQTYLVRGPHSLPSAAPNCLHNSVLSKDASAPQPDASARC